MVRNGHSSSPSLKRCTRSCGVRLRGTPARLDDVLRGRSSEALTLRPTGKWSAQEHAGHLLDLESLWLARVDDFQNDQDTLTAADLSNRATGDANHNARPLSDILSQFRAARLGLVEKLSTLPPGLFGRCQLHPRLKQPMRLVDHVYFVAEHDDHHVARIWELLGA